MMDEPEELTSLHRSPDLRFFRWAMICSLPCTLLVLWIIALLAHLSPYSDIPGLTAVAVGILGLFVFFLFLYKYQTYLDGTRRDRWLFLILHASIVLVLFLAMIWLGFVSPWKDNSFWGSYNLELASRSWVIAALVLGTITLLGSLFDFVRKNPDWLRRRETQ